MDALNSFFSSVGQLFGSATFSAGQRALDGTQIKVGDKVLGTFSAGTTDNTLFYVAAGILVVLLLKD